MNEELQFGYPADPGDIDADFIYNQYKISRNSKLKAFIAGAIIMLMFLLYSVTLQAVFFYLMITAALFEIFLLTILKKINVHALKISAYESFADFVFYSSEHDYSIKAHLLYSDIYEIKLGGKEYEKGTISYVNKSGRSTIQNIYRDGSIENADSIKSEHFFNFDMNKGSAEQGFFFYYASRLIGKEFDEKIKKKILSIYGDESMFFNNIE